MHRGAVVLTLRVPSERGELVGYEARETRDVVDLRRIAGHPAADFFQPIYSTGEGAKRATRAAAAPPDTTRQAASRCQRAGSTSSPPRSGWPCRRT